MPNTRVISEPMSFAMVGNLYLKGVVSFVEYKKLLESTFRLQCKKENNQKVDHIVMKWNPKSTSSIPYLKAGLIA